MRRLVNILKRFYRPRRACKLALALAGVVILTVAPVGAEIYRYVDADGVIHYTDHIDKVPAKYKDGVQQQKSLRSSNPSDGDTAEAQPVSGDPDPGETADPEKGSVGDEAGGETSSTEAEGDDNASEEGRDNAEGEPSSEAGEGGEAQGEARDPVEGEAPVGDGGQETGDEQQPSSGDSTDKKRKLEEERQALLEQKEALANNKTYQKRKTKRRYKHRPHIQELAAEEARIDARLEEIAKELQ